MTAKIRPLAVSSFALGMNTRRADFNLKNEKPPYGRFMREIVNADILEGGSLKLRRGYANVLAATAGGSLWSDDTQAYFASGTALVALADVAGTLTPTAVTGASLSSGAPVSFASAPAGGAYWTDGATLGYVSGSASVPLAPPQPTTLPVRSTGVGSLAAGLYSYCFTHTDAAGCESAATPPISIALGASSSLVFTLGSAPPAGLTMKVYISLPNGIEMYAALAFTGAGAQTVSTTNTLGPACSTVGLQNMPAGRFVRYSLGRIVVAVGSVLYFSQPYMPGLFDPTSDFIPFPAPITVVENYEAEGLYVVADQTYWLAGNLADTKLVAVLPLGAVMGSGCQRPDNGDCCWMSTRGITSGTSGGVVALLQVDNVAVGATTAGASLFVQRDGVSQLLSTLNGTALTLLGENTPYTSAEVTDVGGATWLVDVATGASRLYSNHAFTGYAEIAGRYYGVRSTGVFLLEGATDAGAAINASINPGRQDFGSPTRKRMEAAYMTVGSLDSMHLTITDDAGCTYTYDTRRSDATVQQHRLDVGRGLTGNYLSYRITNEAGCAFELAGFELMVVDMTRRLRG